MPRVRRADARRAARAARRTSGRSSPSRTTSPDWWPGIGASSPTAAASRRAPAGRSAATTRPTPDPQAGHAGTLLVRAVEPPESRRLAPDRRAPRRRDHARRGRRRRARPPTLDGQRPVARAALRRSLPRQRARPSLRPVPDCAAGARSTGHVRPPLPRRVAGGRLPRARDRHPRRRRASRAAVSTRRESARSSAQIARPAGPARRGAQPADGPRARAARRRALHRRDVPGVMHNRLAGKRIAVVYVGSVDGRRALAVDADAARRRRASRSALRALKVPVDADALDARCAAAAEARSFTRRRAARRARPRARPGARRRRATRRSGTRSPAQLVDERRAAAGRRPTASSSCARPSRRRARRRASCAASTRASPSRGVPAVGVEATGAEAVGDRGLRAGAASRPSTTSTSRPAGSRSRCCSPARRRATTASKTTADDVAPAVAVPPAGG